MARDAGRVAGRRGAVGRSDRTRAGATAAVAGAEHDHVVAVAVPRAVARDLGLQDHLDRCAGRVRPREGLVVGAAGARGDRDPVAAREVVQVEVHVRRGVREERVHEDRGARADAQHVEVGVRLGGPEPGVQPVHEAPGLGAGVVGLVGVVGEAAGIHRDVDAQVVVRAALAAVQRRLHVDRDRLARVVGPGDLLVVVVARAAVLEGEAVRVHPGVDVSVVVQEAHVHRHGGAIRDVDQPPVGVVPIDDQAREVLTAAQGDGLAAVVVGLLVVVRAAAAAPAAVVAGRDAGVDRLRPHEVLDRRVEVGGDVVHATRAQVAVAHDGALADALAAGAALALVALVDGRAVVVGVRSAHVVADLVRADDEVPGVATLLDGEREASVDAEAHAEAEVLVAEHVQVRHAAPVHAADEVAEVGPVGDVAGPGVAELVQHRPGAAALIGPGVVVAGVELDVGVGDDHVDLGRVPIADGSQQGRQVVLGGVEVPPRVVELVVRLDRDLELQELALEALTGVARRLADATRGLGHAELAARRSGCPHHGVGDDPHRALVPACAVGEERDDVIGLTARLDPAVAAVTREGQLDLGEEVTRDAPLPQGLVERVVGGRTAVHAEVEQAGVHLDALEPEVDGAHAREREPLEDDVRQLGQGVQLGRVGLELLGARVGRRPHGVHRERDGLLGLGGRQREHDEGKEVSHGVVGPWAHLPMTQQGLCRIPPEATGPPEQARAPPSVDSGWGRAGRDAPTRRQGTGVPGAPATPCLTGRTRPLEAGSLGQGVPWTRSLLEGGTSWWSPRRGRRPDGPGPGEATARP